MMLEYSKIAIWPIICNIYNLALNISIKLNFTPKFLKIAFHVCNCISSPQF